MKTTLLILVIFSSAGLYLFSNKTGKQIAIPINADTSSRNPVNFKTQIQPILQKNCSPCHFPGGKLYEKLPFDDGKTILSLKAGVSKRIKDEKEKALISLYIDQNILNRK